MPDCERDAIRILHVVGGMDRAGEFIWLMVASAIWCVPWFVSSAMTAARRFRAQLPLFAAVCASGAATCFCLVPVQGLFGAAMAVFIAALVQAALSLLVVVPARRRPLLDAGV